MTSFALAWEIEWCVALRRRRLFVLNAVVPLLLVVPLAAADAPPVHEAAALAVLFVLFGVFGSSVPLVRDGASGLILRLVQQGLPERALLGGRIAAQSVLDLLQLVPAATVALLFEGAPPSSWAVLAGTLALAVGVANVVGAWAAAAARSLAEAALFSAVLALLLLHAAGVFRTPPRGSLAGAVEGWSPFRLLHETLLGALGGGPLPGNPAPALLAAASLVLLTWISAPLVLRLLVGAGD